MLSFYLDLPDKSLPFKVILAILLVSFLAVYVRRGLLLKKTLDGLIKAIPEAVAAGRELGPLFEHDHALKQLWQEFRKTLHEQKELNTTTGQIEVVGMRPTVPAETFFNSQVVVDNRLYTDLARLVQASEDSATQTKILKDALVADLKQVLSELTERQIGHELQQCDSGPGHRQSHRGQLAEGSSRSPVRRIARSMKTPFVMPGSMPWSSMIRNG